jgi:2-polyprenyl-3-methyl-5-hydroxy-6-metoxy-1,4-benzoquinol methylase
MKHVWWRAHLRKLEELGSLGHFGSFGEVDELMPFLTEALDLPTGARVLDLGCGRGSVSIRLAQWGYEVTGVDEAAPMLDVAREAGRKRGVEVDFRAADPRQIPERSAFDGAVVLDFGLFSDADNAAMMRAVAAAVRPGGRVLFGTGNPYYWAREPFSTHQVIEGTDVIQRYRFDFPTGSVVSRVRLIPPDGKRRDLPEARHRAYTIPELRSLSAAIGLADLRIYGQEEEGAPRPDLTLDGLRTPFFYCVALRPVLGETGEGI